MKGVFAPPGAFIPGKNVTLGVGKIRDVESRGMLVSEFELQLSDDHEGIIDLPDDAPVGANYAQWAGLDDPVIEINLTPNRADCTAVHGIARDLAAADMGKFKDAGIKAIKGEFPCPVAVKIEAPELCPAFALRLVRGVKNGPSPDWLQKRLIAIGLRPINALVDITNFITFDRGRPLHVFDAAKVRGNLAVRRARAGETLLALDGKTYTLDETVCVIADEEGVEVALRHHGRRKNRLLGNDDRRADRVGAVERDQYCPDRPQARHQLRRPLPLRARRRSGFHAAWPRAGDPNGAGAVRRHAVGDSRCRRRADAPETVIDFPLSEFKRLAGLAVPLPEMRRVLDRLGFFVAGQGERVKVAVPSWRRRRAEQGRRRRRDRAHPWRRSRTADAIRARRRAAQAGADADPSAHAQSQARARPRAI